MTGKSLQGHAILLLILITGILLYVSSAGWRGQVMDWGAVVAQRAYLMGAIVIGLHLLAVSVMGALLYLVKKRNSNR